MVVSRIDCKYPETLHIIIDLPEILPYLIPCIIPNFDNVIEQVANEDIYEIKYVKFVWPFINIIYEMEEFAWVSFNCTQSCGS